MQVHTHTHTRTQYTPLGPVLPAGLSAFSLLPHHLHTNTVCWGRGTNTRHSTFHYWALIIVGWGEWGWLESPMDRGREGETEREARSERDRRRDRMEGWQALLSLSVKTHLGPMHAQLKTSLRHLLALSNTDIVVVHPHPFPFPFLFSSASSFTPFPPQSSAPPPHSSAQPGCCIIGKKPQKMHCARRTHRWFTAGTIGITQVRSTQGFCLAAL